ncbi:MAG TPA: DUF4143 domain-containing protein, partial [Opitutaceae bacterium]|nr:DUF4143 domain-containing protein [Opitutaceae bacterium]
TGFVCFARGWDQVRSEDAGLLWEHLVLDTLLSVPVTKIHFWRDKQQREVDFVIPHSRNTVDAIECKWSAEAFGIRNLAAFRDNYPNGRNFVVSPQVTTAYDRRVGELEIRFLPVGDLRFEFSPSRAASSL